MIFYQTGYTNNVDVDKRSPNDLDVISKLSVLAQGFATSVFEVIGIKLDYSIQQIAEMFCAFKCNSFSICDEEMNSVGTGLYLDCSVMNHSCEPNCAVVFKDAKLYVKCINERVSKGVELTISYIDLAQSTPSRQLRLEEQYCFKCACKRCELHTGDDQLLQGNELTTSLPHFKDIKKSKQQHLDVLETLYQDNVSKLGEMNENLILLSNLLCSEYINVQQFQKSLLHASRVLKAFEMCYPALHPMLGIQFALVSKLQNYLGHSAEANHNLQKAVHILNITHSHSTHPFVQDITNSHTK
ncbi:histone-lysine N-methyltransferase [Acrasis kona]|uniref:Histone-lysine N-methyltransferase n=1 Tax=Acrasis kona TaxID=1008807 RepID=A0AAW2ZAW2_9EUKA